MLNKISYLLLLLFSSLLAQNKFEFENISLSSVEAQRDINILAVMVEFQPDDFDLTYGDGTFGSIYSQDYGNDILDPLPHDKSYFEDHLEFAQNYFQKVSRGKVNIEYNILPSIITVSNPMREYSPTEGESFEVLANFSEEVWDLVDAEYSGFDYSQYNLFVIFHAGVGKDISTSDLFGEARDLPSIYLSLNSFREFKGELFNGFQQSDGSLISNTIILPETESREESGFGGVALLELSINGLIVSSIASHMGLPDLFDAETGKSAIGRFGLMDGQSLFAFAGLFPPEPSAWEKIYLGWENPIVINSDAQNISVATSQFSQLDSNRIIKVPINSTEYYLIENRARDANNDGTTLTYKVGGQIRTINFNDDLDNFNNAIVDTLKGVILDVDEFDWAVPGNGILIWHIDEKIISEGLDSNRINVGDNRGVDLEEADGIQDIGVEFQTIFGDVVIAEGDEFDLWYSSNSSELYKNEFGIATKPNTNSNNGANSLITFSNFSDIGNQMTFDVSFQSTDIALINNFSLDPQLSISHVKSSISSLGSSIYFSSGDNLYRVDDDTHLLDDFSNNNFAVFDSGSEEIVIGALNNSLNITSFSGNSFIVNSYPLNNIVTAPIAIGQISGNDIGIFLGFENGVVEKHLFNIQTKDTPTLITSANFFQNEVKQIAVDDNEIIAVSADQFNDLSKQISFSSNIKKLLFTKSSSGESRSILLTDDNSIYTSLREDNDFELIFSGSSNIESISIADLKNNGENNIIFSEANKIYAININGSYVENFPYELTIETNLDGFPLIANIDEDEKYDIIVTTTNGVIYAVSGSSGNLINGFPLSTGGIFTKNHSIIKRDNDLLLSAVTTGSQFYLWSLKSEGNVTWGSEFGNNLNSSFLDSASDENFVSTFFPKNRTYNWPNPVYGNETFIRTYVSEDSKVKVKVFDLAGDFVDELEFSANGGIDSESKWDVTKIQSGAYIAHIEITSNSGKTDSKIIKIAVVK